MFTTKNLIIVLGLALATLSCQPPQTKTEPLPNWAFDPSLEAKVDSIVGLMTLEEKVAMAHANGKFFSAGVERLGIPEVTYADGPLGVREEIERNSWNPAGWDNDSASFFPAGGGLSATWNLELARTYGECIGAEARARDKDYLLAPAINIQRSPLNGRNYEYFSEDPFLNAQIAVPYVQGVQSEDVAACVKHYVINNQETNRGSINVLADERTLREIYLPAFKATAIEGQAYSMMGAYNKFRGKYICENDYMLNQILKTEWGFQGTVMSDWGATHSTVGSANGGLDIEMGTESEPDYNKWFMADALLDSIKAGAVSQETIDEIARRNIRVLLNLKKIDESRSKGAINVEKHRKLMYDAASESIVLLKNEKELLPLDKGAIKSIAVIGGNAKQKHASGGFGAGVKVQYEITPMEGIESRFPDAEITFAEGYEKKFIKDGDKPQFLLDPDNRPNKKLIEEAVKAAKSAEVAIIFAGTNRLIESESSDRKTMNLPYGQEELIEAVTAANPNTVVVMISGTPFDLRRVEKTSSTLVWAWFNGSEAGNALADVITGTVNPSGKLPFTIPQKLEDSPAHATNSFPGDDVQVEYKEGIFVGYRWFDTKGIKTMYPFGYGLSYTGFDYAGAKADKESYKSDEMISISVSITNTGDVDGKEIVQVYMEDMESSLERPKKELKGFTKVALKAGETQEVTIDIAVASLAFYDDSKSAWIVEPGEFKFHVASSAESIEETVSVTVL